MVQSPLRRWKRFFGAFESVDAAMEAFDPVLLPRGEFRSARGDIIERLCDVADDDHAEAERLCLLLDDMMAESLETLRLIPAMPTVLPTADLDKSVSALREHESERVRLLASGIVTGWRLDNLPQPVKRLKIGDHADAKKCAKQPVKILEMTAKMDINKINQQLTDARATRPAKIPETSAKKAVDDHGAGLCYEERMKLAKRKFNEGYREADDAKRQRKIQVVKAPEMLKQRERSRARCSGSFMVNKTFSATRLTS